MTRKIHLHAVLWVALGSSLSLITFLFGSFACAIIWIALNSNGPKGFLVVPVVLCALAFSPLIRAIRNISILRFGSVCNAVVADTVPTGIYVGGKHSRKKQLVRVVCRLEIGEPAPEIIYRTTTPPRRHTKMPCVYLRGNPSLAVLPDTIGYGLEVSDQEVASKAHAYGVLILALLFTGINLTGAAAYLL